MLVLHIGGSKNMQCLPVPDEMVKARHFKSYTRAREFIPRIPPRSRPLACDEPDVDTYWFERLVYKDGDSQAVRTGFVARLAGLSDAEFWGIVYRHLGSILSGFAVVKEGVPYD